MAASWRLAPARAVVAPVYARLPGGCRIDRDTETTIAEAGFAIERCERFLHADGRIEPAIPHIFGSARPLLQETMAG